jgi:hypothetical protein
MFGPNQVGELLIGNSASTETTIQGFIANAADRALRVFSDTGTAVAANLPFEVFQKTTGDATKGLNYEFSDTVDPRYVERVTVGTYLPETQKRVTCTVATPTVNTTYEIEVRLYNDGGSLSPENFAIIQGFYVTGSTTETATQVKDGLVSSLQKNLMKRGNFELSVVSTGASTFTIEGKFQKVVPGKIIGKQIEFDVLGKSYSNAFDVTLITQNTGLVTVALTTAPNPGNGTAKHAINYEWFVKGYKYEVYRQTGYPADFSTPYYASATGLYNTINIVYYTPRKETSVERQYKVLTIMIDKGTDTLANNAATNAILTSIRTAVGTNAVVPANLPVA